jgi:hypothetical protein
MFFMTFMTDSSGTDGLEYLIYRLFTTFLSNSVGRNPGPPWILCELVRLAEPIVNHPQGRLTAHLLPLRCTSAVRRGTMGKSGCSHSFCRATACNDKVLSCPPPLCECLLLWLCIHCSLTVSLPLPLALTENMVPLQHWN